MSGPDDSGNAARSRGSEPHSHKLGIYSLVLLVWPREAESEREGSVREPEPGFRCLVPAPNPCSGELGGRVGTDGSWGQT